MAQSRVEPSHSNFGAFALLSYLDALWTHSIVGFHRTRGSVCLPNGGAEVVKGIGGGAAAGIVCVGLRPLSESGLGVFLSLYFTYLKSRSER